MNQIGLNVFFFIGTLIFSLLLLPFSFASRAANQPLGFLFVEGEISADWQYRELPIFDSPAGNRVGSVNLVREGPNWCLQNPKIQGVRRTLSPEDSSKVDGCKWNYTYIDMVGRYARILANTFPEEALWIGTEFALPENPLMRVSLGANPIGQDTHLRPARRNSTQVIFPEPRKPPVSAEMHSQALGYVEYLTSYGPDNIRWNDEWTLEEFPAFDSPGGQKIGSLNISIGQDLCLFNPSIRGVRFQPLDEEVYGVAKCWLFIYYEESQGYARILEKSVPEGFWIPLEYSMPENPRMRLAFTKRDFLNNLQHVLSYSLSNYHGHSLMDRPAETATQLVTLDSRQHAFARFTGATNGQWAEAIFLHISQYPPDEQCFTADQLQPYALTTYRGWLKLLGEDGSPGEVTWQDLC